MNSPFDISETININEVVYMLVDLQLSIIPQEYVDQVINSNYNYSIFPETYEVVVEPDIDFSLIINDSCRLLSMYLQNQPPMCITWNQFITHDLNSIYPKPLICLLNCYIQKAIRCIHEPLDRKNGLLATRLFFLASTFKGSCNNGFYHNNILSKCSELMKSCVAMLKTTGNMSFSDNIQLKDDEKNDMIIDILAIVRDTVIMVKQFKFVDEVGSLEMIIDIMIDVTRLEKISGNIFVQIPTDELSYSTLAYNAYHVLINMFNDNCGTIVNVGKNIMHYMITGLLVDEQHEMQLTTRQFNVIKDHHLSFIQKLTATLRAPFECILEILLQHLIHRGPDRCELKPRQCHITLEVWKMCPNNVRVKIKYYLLRMVYDEDANIRTVALEILFKLLSEPEEIEPEDPQLLPLMPATKHEFILAVILSKFQDLSITVRAKAFSIFSILTAGEHITTKYQTQLIKRVLIDPYPDSKNLNDISFAKNNFHEFYQYLENDLSTFDPINISNSNIYPGAKILLWIFYIHAHDERAYIRRLSLTVLCNLFLINKKFININYLSLLVDSCSDCAMTIRKVVVSGLTNLLIKHPNNQDILRYWFKGLIYLVDDRDKKIQEMVVECMDQVILKNIQSYSCTIIDDNNNLLNSLPWRVLDYALNEKVFKYMMSLCEKWHFKGFITDSIVKKVMTYISSSNHTWTVHSIYLLQLISHQLTITNILPVMTYFDTQFDLWFLNERNSVDTNIKYTEAQMVLDIIFLNYKSLDKQIIQQLLNKFENLLFDFKVPTRLISKSLDLYTVLQSDDLKKKDFLKNVFQIICNFMDIPTNMNNEEMLACRTFTLGDLSLAQHFKISCKLQQFLLEFLSKTDCSVSPALQSIVVLTIGKLSIIDEQFAKKAIVQFGKILSSSCHPTIQINALTALADLCSQCTTIVEQVIPEMCMCLKAESLPVKKMALKHLSVLLLEDYIKLKDVVFFALLCMLEDTDCQVRQETSSFIVNYLMIKNKGIMEQNFIEVIFYFNGYKEKQSTKYFNNPDLKAFFSMEGDSKKASRRKIYKFMLSHMLDDSVKLKLIVKIFRVFEDIVEDVSKLTDNEGVHATQVMKDAFWILKTKQMALIPGISHNNNDNEELETLETLENVTNSAKKQIIMTTFKITMTEFIVPSILKLKFKLDKNKKILPTVINDLYAYLCVLTSRKSPMKDEVMKLLSVDSDLVAEIEYANRQAHNQNEHFEHENNLGEYITGINNDDDVSINSIQDLDNVNWV